MAKFQSPQSTGSFPAEAESWEIEALGQHGLPVLHRIEKLKDEARRLAGKNDTRSFALLFEERLLNDLIVDLTSAYLDLERVSRHIQAGKYKVGETGTDLYRGLVH